MSQISIYLVRFQRIAKIMQKPGCGKEILQYFRNASDVQITAPAQIAVVGDRLFTDTLLANTMGWHSLWVKDGVLTRKGLVSSSMKGMTNDKTDSTYQWARVEHSLAEFLVKRGYGPPDPHRNDE